MPRHPDDALTMEDADGRRLIRYLAGECSPAEAQEVRAWIATDPDRARIADEFAEVWRATARPRPTDTVDAAWSEFVAARESQRVRPLYAADADRRQAETPVPRWKAWPSRSEWWLRIAAAILLVIAAGALWRLVLSGSTRSVELADAAPAASARVYTTRRGERAEFRLADGSHVRLGPDSRLWVPVRFGAPTRAAYLIGEAAFDVVHDRARPFVVHAAGTVTEDLGTTFDVRAYAGEPVRVVVAHGKVAVRDTARRAAVLGARDMALVSQQQIKVERGIDPDEYLAWTTGRLVFRSTPLRDVAKELERWFDMSVIVEDPTLLTAEVSIAFENDDLDEMLYVLGRTLDARIERHNSRILVHRN